MLWTILRQQHDFLPDVDMAAFRASMAEVLKIIECMTLYSNTHCNNKSEFPIVFCNLFYAQLFFSFLALHKKFIWCLQQLYLMEHTLMSPETETFMRLFRAFSMNQPSQWILKVIQVWDFAKEKSLRSAIGYGESLQIYPSLSRRTPE